MEIICSGQNIEVSDALVAHCAERGRRALRPFASHIARVKFVFVALSGHRQGPGPGRACRVTIDLVSGARVRYEGCAQDYYQAAGQAIAGAGRHIQRALDRRRVYAAAPASTTPPAA